MMQNITRIRAWLQDAFDRPRSKWQYILNIVSMSAVVASIFQITFTVEYPGAVEEHATTVFGIEYLLSGFFTVEILLRVFAKPNPRDYLLTRYGLIDILAVAPTWLGLFFTGLPNLNWLRALRLIRLVQIIEVIRRNADQTAPGVGLLLQLAPFMAYAFILKTIIVVLEGAGYWPEIEGLGTTVSVIGFAIGVLLSTRLGTVQGRMYDFEGLISQYAAAVRLARSHVPEPQRLAELTRGLEDLANHRCDKAVVEERLTAVLDAGPGTLPPPIWLNLSQSASILLQRLTAERESEYSYVLRNVVLVYIVAVVLLVPGLTGLVSAAMVVYILGGMFMLIRNMEEPYSPDPDSLINADLGPLRSVNREVPETEEQAPA